MNRSPNLYDRKRTRLHNRQASYDGSALSKPEVRVRRIRTLLRLEIERIDSFFISLMQPQV